MSRKSNLDETKRREILAILSMGCSRATAAGYVGCSRHTIGKLAARDPGFARQLARAESLGQIELVKSVRASTHDNKQWRAAAWALERRYPEDFARRGPDCLTPGEIDEFLAEVTEIILQELPASRYRKAVLTRLWRLRPESRRERKSLEEPDAPSGPTDDET